MNAVQLFQPSTSSARQLSLTDKLMNDLTSIVDDVDWSDIDVKVQGKSFHCHKNILVARSTYFKEKLRRDRRLTGIVEDGNVEAFELVQRYIYTGTVAIDQADVELIANVLYLSTKYKLDELTDFMSGQIKEQITAPNAVKVFGLMSDMKMNSIAEECLEFIRTHCDECLHSEIYIALNLNNFVHLLKNVSLGDRTQLMVIRKWSKKHPGVDAAKLFKMLDGEIECEQEDQNGKKGENQYILMKDIYGNIVILDADTLEEVATRERVIPSRSQIAVCNGILFAISTDKGEIHSTPVSSLLNSQPIKWDKCLKFRLSKWTRGNVAVAGAVIYFMDLLDLWEFDTCSQTVTQLHEFGISCGFYSLVELNGLIYGWIENRFQVTDGMTGWKPIHLPTDFGQYPYSGSLIKMHDSVCLVGGYDESEVDLSGMLCYDTKSNCWTKSNSTNQARSLAATVSRDGGRSLHIGGFNGQWMDTIELLDHQTKQWSLIDYKVNLEYPEAVIFSV